MVCNMTNIGQPTIIVVLMINFSGIMLSFISVICIVTNTYIDQSLRGILLSFSIANSIGTGMLTFDSIILLCVGNHFLTFAVTITMTLSVSHMMLLILSEYISITSSWKQRAGDHTGLLLISWIISLTLGGMNVVTIDHASKTGFAIVFVFALLFMLRFYFVVITKHKKKKYLLEKYKETFLRTSACTRKTANRSWRIRILAIMIFSYITCSIPLVLNEFREGIGPHISNPFYHTVSLMIYSIQFIFPSSVCIYLRYIQKKITSDWQMKSYRYRDI